MILTKYIIKELCKNQLIVLVILFLVCICQKFLKMVNLVVDGNISICLIFICIALSIPELGKLIIPFSVLVSVPLTFYRLHVHNEILGMYICAINKCIFIKGTLFFSGIILILSGINVTYVSPYCGLYQNKLLFEMYHNVNLVMLTEKKFQVLINKCLVLFIDDIRKKSLYNVFLSNKDKDIFTTIIAEQAEICYMPNGMKLVNLERGICYEIYNKNKLYEDVFITKFAQYQLCLDQNIKILSLKNKINYMTMCQLWHSSSYEARIEFHWRLILLVSVIIMPMITTLLFITITPNYLFLMILTFFLYVMFFVLQILLRFYMFVDTFNPIIYMWKINIIYFMIIGILNFWNSYYIRKIFFMIKFCNKTRV